MAEKNPNILVAMSLIIYNYGHNMLAIMLLVIPMTMPHATYDKILMQ
jgi:hypothetical protein